MTRRRADQIAEVEPRWLLEGILPTGRIVTVSGPSAAGKSTFTAGLIGELTRAGHDVGLNSVEEVWTEDVIGRLKANNVDLSRVVELTRDDVSSLDTNAGLTRLEGVILDEKLSAVVIDPITSAAAVDSNKGSEVRQLMEDLSKLAESTDTCLILLLHDRKGTRLDRGPSADMVRGSQEFTAVARVNLRLALDPLTLDGPREEVRRLVGPVATNLHGVIGCREALSVQVGRHYRWEWTSPDLRRGIESVWDQRADQAAAVAKKNARDAGGEAVVSRFEAQRLADIDRLAGIAAEEPGITRKAALARLGWSEGRIKKAEKAAERAGRLTVNLGLGSQPTTYSIPEAAQE